MKHSNNIKQTFLIIILSLLLGGCEKIKNDSFCLQRSGFYFDTLITITIYNSPDPGLLDECFDMCGYYEDLLSMTKEGSDISRINNAGCQPVSVSPETLEMLLYAQEYYDLSKGKLDISVAPLSMLFTEARENKMPPGDDKITDLLAHTGYNKITLDFQNSCVVKSDPDLMLDPGSLGKGYIAEKLRDHLTNAGVKHALISLGGNITAVGSKPDGSCFRIGIKKPFGNDNETSGALDIKDLSVVTSGVYERYFEYDGVLFHHILDPLTGRPADSDLLSATIISASPIEGDALSTICIIYGLKDSMELINNTSNVEAVFITKDNELHCTDGARDYLE
jgi:thiamine biosynthesis lipoprotein